MPRLISAACRQAAQPPWHALPHGLPDGLARPLRILQLIDADAISASLVHDVATQCACERSLRSCLEIARVCAASHDPECRVRCAASVMTALHHVDVLTTGNSVMLAIRSGVEDARGVLLEEMAELIHARVSVGRSGGIRLARLPNLLILVATNRAYTPAVRRLRLLGIPCWLLVPGRYVAPSLRACACAVSFIGQDPSARRRP